MESWEFRFMNSTFHRSFWTASKILKFIRHAIFQTRRLMYICIVYSICILMYVHSICIAHICIYTVHCACSPAIPCFRCCWLVSIFPPCWPRRRTCAAFRRRPLALWTKSSERTSSAMCRSPVSTPWSASSSWVS